MRPLNRAFFHQSSMLLLCGLLSGVVVAAAAFPAVAMSGLAAKAGGEGFRELPSQLKDLTAPQTTEVYASDGKTKIATFYEEFRNDVPLNDIAKPMRDAIVAAEDHKFYDHNGVDLKGIARAAVSNQGGKADQQGASTLTMQYVRMALTNTGTPQEILDATEDTPTRKISEIKYALQLEKEIDKDEILRRYLNAAPFGNGAYGIQAASQVYFRKKAKDLDVAEAALLAGMVKAPSGNDPTTTEGHARATERRDWVVDNMLGLKMITQEQAEAAKKEKVPTTAKRTGNGCTSVTNNNYGFFCDFFYRWWTEQEQFGANEWERARALKAGGYRIVSTLDVKAQKAARKRIDDQLSPKKADALLLAAVEPGSGRVRALAANRTYKIDDPERPQNKISSDPAKAAKGIRGSHPNTTNPLISGGGDIVGYQAGSVFKMFTMIAALEQGLPLAHTIDAQERYISPTYLDSGAPAQCGGHYCPTNAAAGETGPFNMWTGFGASVNTYFVPLEEQVGAEKVVDAAERFGVRFRDPHDYELATKYAQDWGAFTLGVSASTPLDIANAYATLAADGKYCEPLPVQQIKTMSGEQLDVANPRCKKATTSDVARAAIDAARCPVGDQAQLGSCGGRATARGARGIVGHPIFGKTGTTDAEKTASLVVGTTSMVVAGYLVNPDYPNHPYKMDHDIVNPAVEYTLADIMDGKDSKEFKKPGGTKISQGEQRSIPDVTCTSVNAATSRLEDAGFIPTTGGEVESDCPAGQVAGTTPSGSASKGSGVSLQISKGRAVPAPTVPEQPGGGRNRPGGGR